MHHTDPDPVPLAQAVQIFRQEHYEEGSARSRPTNWLRRHKLVRRSQASRISVPDATNLRGNGVAPEKVYVRWSAGAPRIRRESGDQRALGGSREFLRRQA